MPFDSGLRTGREEERSVASPGGVGGVLGDSGAAVVRQPFDGVRCLRRTEAALDRGDHEIAHHLTGDAVLRNRLIAGCIASSTSLSLSAVDHRRRTEVITSILANGPPPAFDIVVLIGGCLCPIGSATRPAKTGCASLALKVGSPKFARNSFVGRGSL